MDRETLVVLQSGKKSGKSRKRQCTYPPIDVNLSRIIAPGSSIRPGGHDCRDDS